MKQRKQGQHRRPGEVAINLSGLSDKGKTTILKAIAEDEAQQRKK